MPRQIFFWKCILKRWGKLMIGLLFRTGYFLLLHESHFHLNFSFLPFLHLNILFLFLYHCFSITYLLLLPLLHLFAWLVKKNKEYIKRNAPPYLFQLSN